MRTQISSIAVWIQAVRVYAFPATLVPLLVSLSIAVFVQAPFSWVQLVVIVLGVLSLHAGTNLINDYYDFKNGQDTLQTLGSSRVLVEGLVTPAALRHGIGLCYVVAAFCGAFFIVLRGWPVLVLALCGLLGGYCYTGGPWPLKYRALGELAVFVLLGPLLCVGAYFALTGGYVVPIAYVSIMVGLLSAAILTANNLRDIADDRRGGIRTLATVLGFARGLGIYTAELLVPYAVLVGGVLLRIFPSLTLLVLATLPWAGLLLWSAVRDKKAPVLFVEHTARLQLFFGLLLSLGFFRG